MKYKFNYRLMLASNGIAVFAFQLIGPFFVIFLNDIGGGIENLGLLFGAGLLASAIATYFIGKASDKFGRKPFLILSSFGAGITTILYLYVQNLPQLYTLQIFSGIVGAMWGISEGTFMSDITHKKTRGKSFGFYEMFLGIIGAVGLMIGGFVIGKFGFEIIFWFVGIMSILSGIIFLWIREKRK